MLRTGLIGHAMTVPKDRRGRPRPPCHRKRANNVSSWSLRDAIGLAADLWSVRGAAAAELASHRSRRETRTHAAASHISLGRVATARQALAGSAELAAIGIKNPRAHIMCRITALFDVIYLPPFIFPNVRRVTPTWFTGRKPSPAWCRRSAGRWWLLRLCAVAGT